MSNTSVYAFVVFHAMGQSLKCSSPVIRAYGNLFSDHLVVGGVTHLITEARAACGRNTGYAYANLVVLHLMLPLST